METTCHRGLRGRCRRVVSPSACAVERADSYPGSLGRNHQVKSGREALSRCRGPSGGGVGPSRLLHSALLRQHSRRALVNSSALTQLSQRICLGRRGWSRSWQPGRPPGNSPAPRRRSHQTLAGTGFTNARRPRTVVRSGFDRIDSGDPRHAAESGPTGRSRERQEPVSSGAVAELCAIPGNHHLPDLTRHDLTRPAATT